MGVAGRGSVSAWRDGLVKSAIFYLVMLGVWNMGSARMAHVFASKAGMDCIARYVSRVMVQVEHSM